MLFLVAQDVHYHSLIKVNITGVLGQSWVSITNKLYISANHDTISFLEMPLSIIYFIILNSLAQQESDVDLNPK